MGTDIHGFIELKKDGRWVGAHKLDGGSLRFYEAFWALFGVRSGNSSLTPIAPKRGLPKDMSEATKALLAVEHGGDRWGDTWISASELASVDFDAVLWPLSGTDWSEVVAPMVATLAKYYEARLVVWFDN